MTLINGTSGTSYNFSSGNNQARVYTDKVVYETFEDMMKKSGIKYDEGTASFVITKCSEPNCNNTLTITKQYKNIINILDNQKANRCEAHKVLEQLKK
jgi:hypothetical protein